MSKEWYEEKYSDLGKGTIVPAFSNEEIVNPDIPTPYDGPTTSSLLWGDIPTLVEKLRFGWLKRKHRKEA